MNETPVSAPPLSTPLIEQPPYTPPDLRRVGQWQTVTLQISVPIGPGGLPDLLTPQYGNGD